MYDSILYAVTHASIDLVDERQVSRQSGEELASQLNAPFMETSARDSCNVDVTFLNLAKTLVNTRYVDDMSLLHPYQLFMLSELAMTK
jgi:hypothetical protein